MYRALETPTTIRLLDLHPGHEADPISCSLRHCDLDKDQAYEAISYVWGEPVFSVNIVCDDQRVYITPSLYQVLKRVRLVDATRAIWADGLCINQKDVVERSCQVQLMRRIYSSARRVLVWLGPDAHGAAADAFSICREVSEAFVRDIVSNSTRTEDLLLPPNDLRWLSLQCLVNCAWWSRVWVLQELKLARVASILWGLEEIDWSHIQHTSKHLQCIVYPKYPQGVFPGQLSQVDLFVSGYPGQTVEARTGDHENESDIITLLRLGTKFSCSDDRDRIYGILGVTKERDAIVPNYTKTTDEVYWDFALWLLKRAASRRNLDHVFTHIGHERVLLRWDSASLPSWVPTWNVTDGSWFSTSFIVSEAFQKAFRNHNAEYTLYISGQEEEVHESSHFHDASRSNAIRVCAAFLDEVVSVSDIFYDHNPSSILKVLLAFWDHSILPLLHQHTHRDFLSELCVTLVEDYAAKSDHSLIIAYLEWALAIHEHETNASATIVMRCHSLLGHLRRPAAHDLNPESPRLDSIIFIMSRSQHKERYFREALPGRLRSKRLFLTKEGYLGLGPAACTVGDQLVLLPNVGAPMVLRQQDTFFQVVGPSHLALFETDDVVTEDVRKEFERATISVIELR